MSESYVPVQPPHGLAQELVWMCQSRQQRSSTRLNQADVNLARKDIVLGGSTYLSRLVIAPWHGADDQGYCVYVHAILRSDQDREYHDHPFDFASYILHGEYVEHCPGKKPRTYRAGDWNVKRAEELHRLEVPETVVSKEGEYVTVTMPVVTVVFRGPRRREWGFQGEDGRWVSAREFLAARGEAL